MLEFLTHFYETPYFKFLAISLSVYLVLWFIKTILLVKLKSILERNNNPYDDMFLDALAKTKLLFILSVALYAGSHALLLNKNITAIITKLLVVVVGVQFIIWGQQLINSWLSITIIRKNNDPSVKTSLNFVGILLKTLFIVLVILFVLNNLGVDVTTFVAGLGVGGIAIALATQNILGDLFSSLSIILDKPFIVGDFINLGPDTMGTIEHVGLKTTRVKSLSGEQIVISNSDLLSSRIRNFKRMEERRVVFQLGVTYQTKREDLHKAPDLIKKIITDEPDARFDRAHFIRFGASSLDFEIVYWVTNPDYNLYADIHQRILYSIHETFEGNGLDFAYPTQTLFVHKTEVK